MSYVSVVLVVVIVFILLIPFYRVVKGPTVFDRLLAVSAIGSKVIALICLTGMAFDRLDMFLDIALAYAILNFLGGIAVAEYFRLKREA